MDKQKSNVFRFYVILLSLKAADIWKGFDCSWGTY